MPVLCSPVSLASQNPLQICSYMGKFSVTHIMFFHFLFSKGNPYCQYLSSLIMPCSTQEGWQLYSKAFINWKSQINGRKVLCGRVSVTRRICPSPKENVSILYLGICTFFDHKWKSINKAEHGQDISVFIKHGILVVVFIKVLFPPCHKPAVKELAVHCLLCSLGCLLLHSVNALSSLSPSPLGFVWPRCLLGI